MASLWPLGWTVVFAGQIMYFTWQAQGGVDLSVIVLNWWLLMAFLFGPPALLLVAWAMARRRESASKTTAATVL